MVPYRAFQGDRQNIEFNRFCDKVVRTCSDGGYGRFQAAEGGHHDDWHVGAISDDPLAQLRTAHSRHL